MKNKKFLTLITIYFSVPIFVLAVQNVGTSPLQPIPDGAQPYVQMNTNIQHYIQNQDAANYPTPPYVTPPTVTPPDLPPDTTNTYVINGSNNTTNPNLPAGDVIVYQNGNNFDIGIITASLSSTSLSVNGVPLPNGIYNISIIASGPVETLSFTTGTSANAPWVNVSGNYVAPKLGDIVLFQEGNSNAEWSVVTSLSGNINGFTINDNRLAPLTTYKMTRINTPNLVTTVVDPSIAGKLLESINFRVGDWVIANLGNGYVWAIVTTAESIKAGGTVHNLRLNNSSTPPMFKPGTRISKIKPPAPNTGASQTPVYLLIVLIIILALVIFVYIRSKK